jgi:hypothetical protein
MKCFLFDTAGRTIESSEAIEMDCSEILAEWDNLTREVGSFLGILNPPHPAVQFMWDDSNTVSIDVPQPEMGGSSMKESNFRECREVISRICNGADPLDIEGLQFVSW